VVLNLEKGKVSPTIRAEMGGHPPIVMLEHICLESHPSDSRIRIDDSGTIQTLRSRMGTGGGNEPMLMEKIGPGNIPVLHNGQIWNDPENDLSPCLRARMGTGGNCTPMVPEEDDMSGHYVVRRITPKECERLQGFPDEYTNLGEWKDQKGKLRQTTDAARYKALGNSMAVPVMKWIAQRIDWALAHPITENTAEPLDWQPDLF